MQFVIKPRALLFTLFGEFTHPLGQREVRVGKLVDLADAFNISGNALRTALSRVTQEGWLTRRQSDGKPSYGLSDRGRHLIEEGIQRIYHPRPRWDGQWLMVAYSVPEVKREVRDRVRLGLGYLGLGSLGNGLYVTPHDLARDVRELIERDGLEGELTCVRGYLLLPEDRASLVRRAWDLDEVARGYTDFVRRTKFKLRADRRRLDRVSLTEAEAFIRRTLLIHEFRRFPFSDPDLPPELLPRDWPGTAARRVFLEYRELLREMSNAYYLAR